MKFTFRTILLISLIFAFCLVGIGLGIYHHYTDYDLATILRTVKPQLITQKTATVSALSPIHHIFVIVEENHNWQTIYKNPSAPYINNKLLPQGAYAQNYHNLPKNLHPLHPSEPNYIFLESGMITFPDHTFTTDDPPSAQNATNSYNHITYLLEKNNLTWKSYQEDIVGKDCPINPINNYAPKHNPFIFFQDVSGNPPTNANSYCQQHIRPIDELQKDLQTNTVSNYTFITPNLQHDMHDGTVAQADTWLSQTVPMILNSKTFKEDGALFITWDEGADGSEENKPIGMIILSPFVKTNYSNALAYSHASFVKTVEEVFHISPLLGLANDPQEIDLSDFFQVKK